MKGKLKFTGSFGPYFWGSLGRYVLAVVTFGVLAPLPRYWQQIYLLENTEIVIEREGPGGIA